MASTQESAATTPTAIQQYAEFPFDSDAGYQQGLESILAGNPLNAESNETAYTEMLRKTRVFYFNRVTGSAITLEQALQAELGSLQSAPSAGPSDNPPTTEVLSFAQLKELIESGKMDQIPNNKIIPSGVNEEPASTSSTAPRKKPWEIQAESDA